MKHPGYKIYSHTHIHTHFVEREKSNDFPMGAMTLNYSNCFKENVKYVSIN